MFFGKSIFYYFLIFFFFKKFIYEFLLNSYFAKTQFQAKNKKRASLHMQSACDEASNDIMLFYYIV